MIRKVNIRKYNRVINAGSSHLNTASERTQTAYYKRYKKLTNVVICYSKKSLVPN